VSRRDHEHEHDHDHEHDHEHAHTHEHNYEHDLDLDLADCRCAMFGEAPLKRDWEQERQLISEARLKLLIERRAMSQTGDSSQNLTSMLRPK